MKTKDLPPHIQSLLKKIKQAKREHAALKELAESQPVNYQLETSYEIAGTEQSLTFELAAESDLTAWKESERLLREIFSDESYQFIEANIYEKRKLRFTTTDNYFYFWRKA